MTVISCVNPDEKDLQLIRYVKPSHIENGSATDEEFQLREDRSPPEEYISFFHSTEKNIENKIQFVIFALRKRQKNFAIKKTGGFLFLNSTQASEDINITNEIVQFKKCNYPHYGMYYLSDDIVDIIEAKTILMYYSELYLNQGLERSVKSHNQKIQRTV